MTITMHWCTAETSKQASNALSIINYFDSNVTDPISEIQTASRQNSVPNAVGFVYSYNGVCLCHSYSQI